MLKVDPKLQTICKFRKLEPNNSSKSVLAQNSMDKPYSIDSNTGMSGALRPNSHGTVLNSTAYNSEDRYSSSMASIEEADVVNEVTKSKICADMSNKTRPEIRVLKRQKKAFGSGVRGVSSSARKSAAARNWRQLAQKACAKRIVF